LVVLVGYLDLREFLTHGNVDAEFLQVREKLPPLRVAPDVAASAAPGSRPPRFRLPGAGAGAGS
jgi:hypothetical protein